MGIDLPAAHILDEQTGEYRVVNDKDAPTSGGDIGAQVPIFPVVWVSDRDDLSLSFSRPLSANTVKPLTSAQVKGTGDYHGGQRATMTRENVTVQRGWVTSSGNRREWLFAQLGTEHRACSGVQIESQVR